MTPWDRRIRRAGQLAAQATPSESLLTFYTRLLHAQKAIYNAIPSTPAGVLDRDLTAARDAMRALLRDVVEQGPAPLAAGARGWLDAGEARLDDELRAYWRAPSDRRFFAKAILQPYGERLAASAVAPADRDLARADNRCPRCGGAPQLSVLEAAGAMPEDGGSPGRRSLGEGGRQLLCADCLTLWPFRRVLCPHCGEEDEHKLGYFRSPDFGHLRVDACDTCRRYLKTVDLGQLGLAVPLVDEVAGAPLDLWARERGYEKIELNLLGL